MSEKVKKQKPPYAQIANDILNDKEISFKAKGLLSYMLSKGSDWHFTIKGIMSQTKDGQNSITSAMDELKANGYVVYEKHMDGSGTYHLFQHPKLENPNMANPKPENPHVGNTNLGKSNLLSNTIEKSNKEESNTENLLFPQSGLPTETLKTLSKKEKEADAEKIDFDALLAYFNKVSGRKCRVMPNDAKKSLQMRLKEGYGKSDVKNAIDNAFQDEFHRKDNFRCVTLEFIFRSKIFDRYASMPPVAKVEKKDPDAFYNA